MPQITVRGISPEVEKEIRRISKKKNISINQVIKEIIHKEFGMVKKKPLASSLKKLAGGWSRDDADAFESAILSCEQIDVEMWQ